MKSRVIQIFFFYRCEFLPQRFFYLFLFIFLLLPPPLLFVVVFFWSSVKPCGAVWAGPQESVTKSGSISVWALLRSTLSSHARRLGFQNLCSVAQWMWFHLFDFVPSCLCTSLPSPVLTCHSNLSPSSFVFVRLLPPLSVKPSEFKDRLENCPLIYIPLFLSSY